VDHYIINNIIVMIRDTTQDTLGGLKPFHLIETPFWLVDLLTNFLSGTDKVVLDMVYVYII
jgi:hypothetical protein